ncbi:unnamed protein product [Notodromas monacha]|uniref:GATOR complex protein NPRL3 n=1 Tax=Notodromas monacha TaxID=399045 RepID=A0A7R9GAX5_9CRUS|nr:unnamed protein product [Notodromas monacha]CAG0915718.1 unnamed protein product [Notodromas monacha]
MPIQRGGKMTDSLYSAEDASPSMAVLNDPLCIFLVKDGSKGDKLMFRYPVPVRESGDVGSHKSTQKNVYSVNPTEDVYQNKPLVSSSIENSTIRGFDDKVLSNLFSAKKALWGERLEVKINDVRFISHPTTLVLTKEEQMYRAPGGSSSFSLFNVVIALRAKASHWVVENYHELCRRLSVALKHEELRCGYLSREMKIMQEIDDQYATEAEKNPDVVHSPGEVVECLESISSYHGFLLLSKHLPETWRHKEDMSEGSDDGSSEKFPYSYSSREHSERLLGDELPLGASPVLHKILEVLTPFKSMAQIAADADVALNTIFRVCCQMVYWGKALIIYPVCESNVYILTPDAPVHKAALQEEFAKTFPGVTFAEAAAEFSFPTSLSQKQSPLICSEQKDDVDIVVWLLQKRLLMQLHIYLYFLPSGRPRKPRASSVRRSSYVMSTRSRQSTPDGELWLYAGDDIPEDFDEEEECEEEDEVKRQKSKEALESLRMLLPELRGWEMRAILKCPASLEPADLKLFARLFPYFNGMHHLEDIMYKANVQRSLLIELTEKFQNVLLTCQNEDPRLSAFYKHEHASSRVIAPSS